tara:strand:- start:609 stop:1754 length:1146 start_codon:yes stop_codon:yes gene_type:complete
MKKTLVCIIAQTRSHEVTWDKFEKNVLNELNADLALCIGVTGNYNFNNPFWKNAKYKWKVSDYGEDYTDAFNYAQKVIYNKSTRKLPDWKILLEIKDFWLGGIKDYTSGDKSHLDNFPKWKKDRVGSSSILLFYRWLLLKKLIENNLIKKYNRFIITRSDFLWPIKHPPLNQMDEKYIWIPDGESFGGITDRYALLNNSDVYEYLSVLNPILTEPKMLYNLMKNKNKWNLEKYLKLYFEKIKPKLKLKYFPYIMYTVFPNPKETFEFKEFDGLNLEWMKTIYSKDKVSSIHKLIVKKPSEYLSSIIYANVIKNNNSWKNMNVLKIKFFFLAMLFFYVNKKILKYFLETPNQIDWKIIENEINKLKKKGGFFNYIKSKYYIF